MQTTILALRQPDPDACTNNHPVDAIYLEEAFSIMNEPRKYFPVSLVFYQVALDFGAGRLRLGRKQANGS